jgi:GH15 family glucan-1,4-alpha-glucosidase
MSRADSPAPVFETPPYPPIEDYALISDCASIALVCRGSVDWCCGPTMDADSCFARLLDWRRGGHCSIAPVDAASITRRYEEGTMVLATRFDTADGSVVLHDFFAARGHADCPDVTDHLARLARCERGTVRLHVEVVPRFDYALTQPDLRRVGDGLYTACGSNEGLLIHCDPPLTLHREARALHGDVVLHQGQALQLSLRFVPPESLARAVRQWDPACAELQGQLERTLGWWQTWERGGWRAPHADALTRRSALVLKALCFERTGAIAAAATTSLPESPGGVRNWDYRFSWIRDSVLAVRALHALGYDHEAERFRAFIERSAAGSAHQLQLMYGLDGRRRLPELTLAHLEGWRRSRPVRIGNAAACQTQLDVYGTLLALAWLSHDEAHPADEAYWNFLVETVNLTCERWREPDHGIWELRAAPRHFVHSKAMCWVALDRGLRLAEKLRRPAPVDHWRATAAQIRADIDANGYEDELGVYRQAYGASDADAALLLLPQFGYVAYDDPRMVRTTDWIRNELGRDGLLLRYAGEDGLPWHEGAFLPCTFWLAQCLAAQGRLDDARRCYERAAGCANELGLFSEEERIDGGGMLGNFPQALTHLSQLAARLALDAAGRGD